MSFYWTLFVTVVFYLELTKGQNFDEVYVVKNPDSNELTCISDDDDAALVWNYDLSTNKLSRRFNNFEPVKPIKDFFSDNFCAIWRSKRCWIKWSESENWRKTSALSNPMAPVVDYRWEGFEEYVVDYNIPQKVVSLNSDDGTAVFSFRGARDIWIHLCRDTVFDTSLCIVIKLSIDGKYSTVETCQRGNIECHEGVRTNNHKYPILDAYEWRTFRLQWINNNQMVKVFRDINENAFLQSKFTEWYSIQSIWISSATVAAVRFHNYNYVLAKESNAEINSAKFHLHGKNFCVNMLVSLCSGCYLIVGLINSKTGEILIEQNIHANVNFHSNGLRKWQPYTVTFPLENSWLNGLKLQFKTSLRDDYNTKDVWWAIDDIRICERNERVRKSTIPFWNQIGVGSEIKCQKFLRNKIVVSDSSKKLSPNDMSWLSKYIRRLPEGRFSQGRTSNTDDCNYTRSICHPENIAIEEAKGRNNYALMRAPIQSTTSQPEHLGMTSQSRGIVKLKWSYPLLAPRKMVRFHIEAHRLNRNHLCTENSTIDNAIEKTDKQSFSMKVDVQTSTEYQLHCKTVDYCNRTIVTATKPISILENFVLFVENQLLSNFKEAVVELEVLPLAYATENTRVVVTVRGVSSCEPDALEDLSSRNDSTKPLMERVIAEFPISSREPVNLTFDANEYYRVEKMCQFQYPAHYWFVITLKDSVLKDISQSNFNSSEVDEELVSNRSEVWLVIIPVLVISLLIVILFILYRRHRKSPGQTSHSPDVPSEPPYLVPLNWTVKTSRVKNNSSNSPYATIMDNSREQSSDAQYVFPPLYMDILDDSEEQANYSRNTSVTPLYVNTLDNSSEQTNLSEDVPSNSKVQASHAESVPSSPLYIDITYDLNKQTSHVQNIPVAPLYVNTLDNSTEQSDSQDDSYEPLYLKIIDD